MDFSAAQLRRSSAWLPILAAVSGGSANCHGVISPCSRPPRFARLPRQRKNLVALLPLPEGIDEIKSWSEKRAIADEYLGNNAKSMFGGGGIAATILPLLTGWITQLLK